MRRLVGVAAGLLLLVSAGSGRAVTLVDAHGKPIGGWAQQWADDSRVATVDMTVRLLVNQPGACPLGCAGPFESPPTVWLNTSVGRATLRWTEYHELGHVLDWWYLSDPQRRGFERIMADVGETWTEAGDGSIPNSGASDDFAELYAFCAEHARPNATWVAAGRWRSAQVQAWPTFATARGVVGFCDLVDLTHYTDQPGVLLTGGVPANRGESP